MSSVRVSSTSSARVKHAPIVSAGHDPHGRAVNHVHRVLNALDTHGAARLQVQLNALWRELRKQIFEQELQIGRLESARHRDIWFQCVLDVMVVWTTALDHMVSATDRATDVLDGLVGLEKDIQGAVVELGRGDFRAARDKWKDSKKKATSIGENAFALTHEIEAVVRSSEERVGSSDQELERQQKALYTLWCKIKKTARGALQAVVKNPNPDKLRKYKADAKKLNQEFRTLNVMKAGKAAWKVAQIKEVRDVLIATQRYWAAAGKEKLKADEEFLGLMIEQAWMRNIYLHKLYRQVNHATWSVNHYIELMPLMRRVKQASARRAGPLPSDPSRTPRI